VLHEAEEALGRRSEYEVRKTAHDSVPTACSLRARLKSLPPWQTTFAPTTDRGRHRRG
jgi:hypothetical protein